MHNSSQFVYAFQHPTLHLKCYSKSEQSAEEITSCFIMSKRVGEALYMCDCSHCKNPQTSTFSTWVTPRRSDAIVRVPPSCLYGFGSENIICDVYGWRACFAYMQLNVLSMCEFIHAITTERDGIAIPEMTKLFESHLYSAHMHTQTESQCNWWKIPSNECQL